MSAFNMAPRKGRPSCLSTEKHDDNIGDLLGHYFGCLTFEERKQFFDENNAVWTRRIKRAASRLIADGRPEAEAYKLAIIQVIESKRSAVDGELLQIKKLRRALKKDPTRQDLVDSFEQSLTEWRKDGPGRQERPRAQTDIRLLDDDIEVYDPEDDVKVPILRYGPPSDGLGRPSARRRLPDEAPRTIKELELNGEIALGSMTVDIDETDEDWSDDSEVIQIDSNSNPLYRGEGDNAELSYVHLPANNIVVRGIYHMKSSKANILTVGRGNVQEIS